jgi:hypothetical protein
MATNKVTQTLRNINEQAGRQLDAMSAHLPPVEQPAMPFDEYLPLALAQARRDEKFARELAKSLHQARYGG